GLTSVGCDSTYPDRWKCFRKYAAAGRLDARRIRKQDPECLARLLRLDCVHRTHQSGSNTVNMATRNELLAAQTVSDPRWAAVVARDPAADGKFFYSVRTTGVYCKPSCAARAARPENITFHETAAAAERAGFRPCKRCRPNQASRAQVNADIVADLCRFIENADSPPTLDELAHRAGLS